MDPLRQPTETESKWYYYDLPSRPKLVARSSFTPYVLPMEGRLPEPKTQTVVGEHDIVAKWNNDPSMLQEQIFNILTQHDVQWQAIDILRIGYSNQEEIPVILSISVSRGTLSWQAGDRVARQCRSALLDHKLDVHCEIKESTVTFIGWGAFEGVRF